MGENNMERLLSKGREKNFLGDRMRELRLLYGFTQEDIAKVLNVSRSTYSYYEIGKTRPDPAVLGKLSHCYNISVEAFYSDAMPLNVPLSDSEGRHCRTSRSSSLDPQKVGDLQPMERSLILFLRANDIAAKSILESLECSLDEARKNNSES